MFGLDAISRNLFNARPTSSMGDFFAGSINSRGRTKSTTSRSSTYTQTTNTGDSSLLKFSRSNSTTSAATTVEDDVSFFSQPQKGRVLKRGVSPAGSLSGNEISRRSSPSLHSPSRSRSRDRGHINDEDGEEDCSLRNIRELNASDHDLALQLALARRNSKNQYERDIAKPSEGPTEPIIYEGLSSISFLIFSLVRRRHGSYTTSIPCIERVE